MNWTGQWKKPTPPNFKYYPDTSLKELGQPQTLGQYLITEPHNQESHGLPHSTITLISSAACTMRVNTTTNNFPCHTHKFTHTLTWSSIHTHGFKAKLSIAKATFNFINETLEVFNSKKVVGSIFCDLEKASDSINHDTIYVNFYRKRSPLHKLIKSYLTNRYQTVLIGGKSS